MYPSKVITTEPGCTRKVSEEQWAFVTEETDSRLKCLPDFNQSSRFNFTIPACRVPSDYYRKMLPNFLLKHIPECMNLRV